MYRAHTISTGIAAPPGAVYEYASDPSNLPVWAPGFVKSIEKRGDVDLPSGTFHNPMRVIPNGADLNKLRAVLEHRPGSAA